MKTYFVLMLKRKSNKLIYDLLQRYGSFVKQKGVYYAPKREKKEILRLPDFNKLEKISANKKELLEKTRKLFHLLAHADRYYREKNYDALAQAIREISEYVKEQLAGIRLYTDPHLKKPVLAVYALSMNRGVYFVVHRPNHRVLLKEVTKYGLDRINPSDILDVWFIEWGW